MALLLDHSALAEHPQRLIGAAMRCGADAADAIAVRSVSLGVEVREGAVEESERSEGDDLGLRVFVGRLEIVTPATEKGVQRTFVTHDSATLKMFGRFLEPLLETMIQKESNPARVQQFYQALNSYYSSEVTQIQNVCAETEFSKQHVCAVWSGPNP